MKKHLNLFISLLVLHSPAMASGERVPSKKEELKYKEEEKQIFGKKERPKILLLGNPNDFMLKSHQEEKAELAIDRAIFATAEDIEYLSKMQDKRVPQEEIDAWIDTLFTTFSKKYHQEIDDVNYNKMKTIIWNKAKNHDFSTSTITLFDEEKYENNDFNTSILSLNVIEKRVQEYESDEEKYENNEFNASILSLNVIEKRVQEYESMKNKKGNGFLWKMNRENHKDYRYFLESHEMQLWLNKRNALLNTHEKSEGDMEKRLDSHHERKKDDAEKIIQQEMKKAANHYENAQVAYIEGKGKEPVEEEQYFKMMDLFLRGKGEKPELFLKGKGGKGEKPELMKKPNSMAKKEETLLLKNKGKNTLEKKDLFVKNKDLQGPGKESFEETPTPQLDEKWPVPKVGDFEKGEEKKNTELFKGKKLMSGAMHKTPEETPNLHLDDADAADIPRRIQCEKDKILMHYKAYLSGDGDEPVETKRYLKNFEKYLRGKGEKPEIQWKSVRKASKSDDSD